MIQQAIAQVLTPLYDGAFSEHSYGFRSGRNAHQAVHHVESGWKQKRRHAVDCDLKALLTLRALRVLLRRICLPAVGSTP